MNNYIFVVVLAALTASVSAFSSKPNCRTSVQSVPLVATCALPFEAGDAGFCDSHCRCIHGAVWGQCINRTEGVASMYDVAKLMCKCSYDDDKPADFKPNPQDLVLCDVLQKNAKFCVFPNIIGDFGPCTTDCVCAHNFNKGACDDRNYCICSN